MASMHNPAHPGEIIKGLCLEPKGLSVADAAERLGVSRKTLYKIINGKGSVTPEMALRLELVFGSTAQTWLTMQATYDLSQLKDKRKALKAALRQAA
jgi:addiction module HigA family antidote